MSTTTVVTVTRQAPPSSPQLSISVTSNACDFHSFASSISGDLDDYTLVPSGTDKMHLVAKKGYKTQFHQVQAERDLLIRSQIYKEMLSELNLSWWCQLPRIIQDALSAGFNSLAQLPTIFALWYLEWHKACPGYYPLPLSLLHFGPVKKPTNFMFIFDLSGQESQLSKTVTTAWNAVPEPTRDLSMLLCWSGLNSVHHRRNRIAYSDVKMSSARSILTSDFGASFAHLHAEALHLADFLFDSEDG